MRMNRLAASAAAIVAVSLALVGCESASPTRTGFLSDYSSLEDADGHGEGYTSPRLAEYRSFVIDPVEIREVQDPPVLVGRERDEVAGYFRDSLVAALRNNGFTVADQSGEGTARVRVAITDIKKSMWWMHTQMAPRRSGVSAGGATMESEIVDSVTGEQLGALVDTGRSDRFDLGDFYAIDNLDSLLHVRDVLDEWARDMGARLRGAHN